MTSKEQRRYVAETGISTCPFCGGIAHVAKVLRAGCERRKKDPEAYAFYVACLSCAATGPWCKSGARGAVINWNRRGKQIKASCDEPGEAAEHLTVSDQTVAKRKRPCQSKRPSTSL